MLIDWFVPREAKFFDMFRETTSVVVEGAKELIALIDDLPNIEQRAKSIKLLEQKADKLTHTTLEALHSTFITPLDSDDMFHLVGKLDDILDYIDSAAQRFHLYDIRTVTPEIRELTKIVLVSAEKVRDAVAGLENMKTSVATLATCKEIARLENDADHLMRLGMSKLFREEIGFKDLIKFKEILELLESVTDRCKEVAIIVEGIVLDHA